MYRKMLPRIDPNLMDLPLAASDYQTVPSGRSNYLVLLVLHRSS